MVDVHCHILPQLDDGPGTPEMALDLARAAESAGVHTVVATPHIRHDHPFPIELVERRVTDLRTALTDADIALEVHAGGEVDLSRLAELDDDTLGRLCLGQGRYILVESPYSQVPSLLETALYDLQLRGFRPVLAHPERSRAFLGDRARLERLVESGVFCSVTALSLTGGFGKTVQKFTLDLFADGLVHNIASDAHDPVRRAPGFAAALERLTAEFGCVAEAARWFTDDAGQAMVEGRNLAGGPPDLSRRASALQRMRDRVGLAR